MDIQSLSQLVRVMEDSKLDVLEVQHGELRVRMEKSSAVPVCKDGKEPERNLHPVQTAKEPEPEQAAPKPQEQSSAKEGWKEIKSPMVGAFHCAKADGKPVGVGTVLKKGATVCVIEAMKLMNDISMPEDGEIVWATAKEGDMVEYGQLLFHYK